LAGRLPQPATWTAVDGWTGGRRAGRG